jgi:hypothetical protein
MAKINNYEFDLAYESYNSNVHELSAVYFRLLYNYPNHESAKFWKKRKEYWNEYKAKQTKLGFKAFKSLEALEKESYGIWSEWVLSKDLAIALSENKPKTVKKKVETISFDKFLEEQYGKVGTKKRAVNDAKLDKIQKEMIKKELDKKSKT